MFIIYLYPDRVPNSFKTMPCSSQLDLVWLQSSRVRSSLAHQSGTRKVKFSSLFKTHSRRSTDLDNSFLMSLLLPSHSLHQILDYTLNLIVNVFILSTSKFYQMRILSITHKREFKTINILKTFCVQWQFL